MIVHLTLQRLIVLFVEVLPPHQYLQLAGVPPEWRLADEVNDLQRNVFIESACLVEHTYIDRVRLQLGFILLLGLCLSYIVNEGLVSPTLAVLAYLGLKGLFHVIANICGLTILVLLGLRSLLGLLVLVFDGPPHASS